MRIQSYIMGDNGNFNWMGETKLNRNNSIKL